MSRDQTRPDEALIDLAQRAGLAVDWIDASNQPQRVPPDVLHRILPALGFPCATDREIADSIHRLDQRHCPAMVTCDAGASLTLDIPAARHAQIVFEDGSRADVTPQSEGPNRMRFSGLNRIGYHRLEIGDQEIALAVAPKCGFGLQDVAAGDRLWGLAVQLYGLRHAGDMGFGDTTALAQFARQAAAHGADALALSPTHALFSGDVTKHSPYSPSNRLFFNPLFADPALLFGEAAVRVIQHEIGFEASQFADAALIDWPAAAAQKLQLLQRIFDSFWSRAETGVDDDLLGAFHAFREAGGPLLEDHARFEALYAARKCLDDGASDWRSWPAALRDPKSPAVAAFASEHAKEVAFHIFLQWLADACFAAAQATTKQAGMRIGLIADLAVGMESGGSAAWSRQNEALTGLTIGAPPDLFNPNGQNWGLTTVSPFGLEAASFEPFLALMRAVLRNAGGVRIDHVMGLKRLWLVPEGAAPSEGAYLAYPFADLLRLLKLESLRHRALVIGEDLGTVPQGFQDTLSEAGVVGMDVLWFARDKTGFLPPRKWRPDAIAMTSTHDLPTLAGWWRGHDIVLRDTCRMLGPEQNRESLMAARAEERADLWQAFQAAGAVDADAPVPEAAEPAVAAAINFVSASPSPLMVLPLEDLLGLEEQPNLPGTIDAHPNWRRRYPKDVDAIFDASVAGRLAALKRGTRT